MTRVYKIVILCVLVAIVLFFIVKSQIPSNQTAEKTNIDTLAFSNTQIWDVDPYPFTPTTTSIRLEDISIDPPPANTSRNTIQEIKLLHEYIGLRTEKKLKEIMDELEFFTTRFGPTTLGEILSNKPNTKAVFEYLIGSADPVVMETKQKFDRVRPSYLDPTLTTAIPVPTHASYPSAHATNASLLSQLLSELDPENSKLYEEAAERIALNREIAGVHYPSDSAAGKQLAQKIYSQMRSDEKFVDLLSLAKAEW